jgi:hypothetical protein
MMVGDALAFPFHWYYSHDVLQKHKSLYPIPKNGGAIGFFEVAESVKHKHPDAAKYFSGYRPAPASIDILHEKREAWAIPGTHYHHALRPGEPTTTTQLAMMLADSCAESGGYDFSDYLRRYKAYYTTPLQNTDTYIEAPHRHFFEQLAAGKPEHDCGMDEDCLSGLTLAMPLMLLGASCNSVDTARGTSPPKPKRAKRDESLPAATTASKCIEAVEAHLRLTQNSDSMIREAKAMSCCIHRLVRAASTCSQSQQKGVDCMDVDDDVQGDSREALKVLTEVFGQFRAGLEDEDDNCESEETGTRRAKKREVHVKEAKVQAEMARIESLAELSHSELFVGADPYALAGTKGCAVFSLR